jgi:hypothetical protein
MKALYLKGGCGFKRQSPVKAFILSSMNLDLFSAVMLNLFQHPSRTKNITPVARWTLKQVQGDDSIQYPTLLHPSPAGRGRGKVDTNPMSVFRRLCVLANNPINWCASSPLTPTLSPLGRGGSLFFYALFLRFFLKLIPSAPRPSPNKITEAGSGTSIGGLPTGTPLRN